MSFKLPALQTVTQCASLVTATRAIWELSRMVRQKRREVDQTREVEDLLDEIKDFVHDGVLTKREWKAFCFTVEEAISKKECTPREAQAKVLDFLEALHSIAQEFQDDDGAYRSEPEDTERPSRTRRRRDSAVAQSWSRTAAYPPSPPPLRSHTSPSLDLPPRRASAPTTHYHYAASSPAHTVPSNLGNPPFVNPPVPVAGPGHFPSGQHYRPPRHPFAPPHTPLAPNGTSTPGAAAGAQLPGHTLQNQPTYCPSAPPPAAAPAHAPSFAAANGGNAPGACPYTAPPNSAGSAAPALHVNGAASPPLPPDYSGPLPIPPSHYSNQQGRPPSFPHVSEDPISAAPSIPPPESWAPNTTFPFSNFAENSNSEQGGTTHNHQTNSNSLWHHASLIAKQPRPLPIGYFPSPQPVSNPASPPIAPSSPSEPPSSFAYGWDGQRDSSNNSPGGFTSPTQEAQAQRMAAAAAQVRDRYGHQRRYSPSLPHTDAPLAKEMQGMTLDDSDVIPPPPHAPHRKQQKSSSAAAANWVGNGFDEGDGLVNDSGNGSGRDGGGRTTRNSFADAVSEAGTYMSPVGGKNKRRRRRQ